MKLNVIKFFVILVLMCNFLFVSASSIVVIGSNGHNSFKKDDKFFNNIGNYIQLQVSGTSYNSVCNGKQLIDLLKYKSSYGKYPIHKLIILTHSDNYGLYMEKYAGLFTDNYFNDLSIKGLINKDAINVTMLKDSCRKYGIFRSNAEIIILGCSTFNKIKNNVALDICMATQTKVVASNGKLKINYNKNGIFIELLNKAVLYRLENIKNTITWFPITNQTVYLSINNSLEIQSK